LVNFNFPNPFNSATALLTGRDFLNSVEKEIKKRYNQFTAYPATSRGQYGLQMYFTLFLLTFQP
jgi:hypothetical protein